jgi:hypothetical protein
MGTNVCALMVNMDVPQFIVITVPLEKPGTEGRMLCILIIVVFSQMCVRLVQQERILFQDGQIAYIVRKEHTLIKAQEHVILVRKERPL